MKVGITLKENNRIAAIIYDISSLKETDITKIIDLPESTIDAIVSNFEVYKYLDGKIIEESLSEDEKLIKEQNEKEQQLQYLRTLREDQCFSIINRGQLGYNTLTDAEKIEMKTWYDAGLAVTDTLEVPDKPTWLK